MKSELARVLGTCRNILNTYPYDNNNNNEAFILRYKMQEQTQRRTSLKQPWLQNRIDMSSI